MSIYTDGSYLQSNPGWHLEDAQFKFSHVKRIIARNGLQFSSAMDVGCGAGGVVLEMARAYPAARFTGYDYSPDAIAIAHRLRADSASDNVRFVCGPPAADACDLVICLDVFEHVPDYLGFLRELRQSGRSFVFNIPIDIHVLSVALRRLEVSRKMFGHLHYFTKETALQSLAHAGFTVKDHHWAEIGWHDAKRHVDQFLLALPRLALSMLSKDFSVRLLGGKSLVVYCTSTP